MLQVHVTGSKGSRVVQLHIVHTVRTYLRFPHRLLVLASDGQDALDNVFTEGYIVDDILLSCRLLGAFAIALLSLYAPM